MAGLAGAGLDLDDAVGDLGHFELEQALHQARMGPGHDDLGALGRLADLDDVGLQAGIGLGPLEHHLFGLGQKGLDPTEVEQRVPSIGLLDHAGDDVALASGVLLVLQLPLGLADPLGHHLAGGLGRDPAEVVGGHVELLADHLALFVQFLGHHPDVHRLGIDRDPRVLVGVGHALVGGLEGVGQGGEQGVDRDAFLARQGL